MIRSRLIPLAFVLAAVAALLWFFTRSRNGAETDRSRADARPIHASAKLEAVVADLGKKSGKGQSRQTLENLRALIEAMPKAEAVAWIESYLASGKDQTTGLEFEIGMGGVMSGWPTFRVFLLDMLLSLDPDAAARVGREILARPTTGDEWALALRNVGRAEAGDDANSYLRERAEALINNPDWRARPSVGYLNAFDVLVHTRATGSTPLLSGLVQDKTRRDLAHAAFLTLDRLVQREPVEELRLLAADTALHASRPEMIAQQFARADLRDPAQQAVVKSWLLDPARTAVELQSFAGVYPNNNRFVSNNLLTEDTHPTGTDLAAHDRAAIEIVRAWQADPEFEPVAGTIREMLARLKSFTSQPESK